MNSDVLFGMALGLQAPWEITDVTFKTNDAARCELHLRIGFVTGSKFKDEAVIDCAVHDTIERQWQRLNFFEHHCFLHCKVPRITTSEGKVRTVDVPWAWAWARAQSGFTLLFEAFALALIEREMPVIRVAQILGVHPQRIWIVFDHWVGKARANDDPSSIKHLGVDETSSKKGHSYVTIGVDLDAPRVIHATEGKGKQCMQSIARHLIKKGVASEQIEQLSMDLSFAFIAGAAESFPKASITFDRFHVVRLLNDAMNKVPIDERKEHVALKNHKYTFLKNKAALSDKKRQALEEMITLYPTLGVAYRLKELFNDLWTMPDKPAVNAFLNDWCAQVGKAKIPAFQKFANTLKTHWSGIIHFVESNITNVSTAKSNWPNDGLAALETSRTTSI